MTQGQEFLNFWIWPLETYTSDGMRVYSLRGKEINPERYHFQQKQRIWLKLISKGKTYPAQKDELNSYFWIHKENLLPVQELPIFCRSMHLVATKKSRHIFCGIQKPCTFFNPVSISSIFGISWAMSTLRPRKYMLVLTPRWSERHWSRHIQPLSQRRVHGNPTVNWWIGWSR